MKKIALILLLIPVFAHAKPEIFKTGGHIRMQIGGSAGANFNYFIYDRNRQDKDVAAGYQGGLFFRISRGSVFGQVEMNYLWSQVFLKNGVFTNEIGNHILFDKLTFRYHTFGIPFIFGAYAVRKPMYKLRFYNGLEGDFITKTRAILNKNEDEIYKLKRSEKRSILRPAQFSYQLGMGMDIAYFIFDLKYNLGFRSFYKEEYRTQTHLFQLTVGAIF